ncbi:STAS domain-containing protein [Streptosporangium vulgare]|uniref:STAS domain-containing protein n=1 Tax=Streptosporangium vulgare TaxID=46190 RepID=UPI003CD0ABBA
MANMDMSVYVVHQYGDTALVAVMGEIDAFNYRLLESELESLMLGGTRHILVDAGELLFCDVSGARALERVHESLRAAGGELFVVPSPTVVRLFTVLWGAQEPEYPGLVDTFGMDDLPEVPPAPPAARPGPAAHRRWAPHPPGRPPARQGPRSGEALPTGDRHPGARHPPPGEHDAPPGEHDAPGAHRPPPREHDAPARAGRGTSAHRARGAPGAGAGRAPEAGGGRTPGDTPPPDADDLRGAGRDPRPDGHPPGRARRPHRDAGRGEAGLRRPPQPVEGGSGARAHRLLPCRIRLIRTAAGSPDG